MLLRVAVWLLENSPLLRRLLWRWWYGRLASRFAQRDWTFMNYGYARPAGAPALGQAIGEIGQRLAVRQALEIERRIDRKSVV